ncbi:hypothetical protein MCAP1_001624 [Malassezia caprae]|uniref:hydroxyethylthiazole kinase n=1 Tax=Malassezia caprae TaxID=1381934 RepID=A0AAF0E6W1_9BASI|nr:hypothetical protein MCAP1_001624 [Malassezia caprae]
MIINDNVDVAAALPERVGLHIGQEDAQLSAARARLGPSRTIGLSVHTPEQARAALDMPVDYAGVGPCWPTRSKAGVTDDDALFPRGAAEVVAGLVRDPRDARPGLRDHLPCVLIGGINRHTAMRTLRGATSARNRPDGVAVISAIVSRRDPGTAAQELRDIVQAYQGDEAPTYTWTRDELLGAAQELFTAYHTPYDPMARCDAASGATLPRPLVQTITSHVSSNVSANMTLAFSASPIMSHQATEAEALSNVISALVLNIGTISPESRQGMAVAGPAANMRGKPVVLDPVGAGASTLRHRTVQTLLNETQVTLIKGNAAEIGLLAGSNEARAQGVDSFGTLSSPEELVKQLARQEGALVLMTGETDYLSDGHVVIASRCGSPLLGRVTATGCSLGCIVAAGLAAAMAHYGLELGDAQAQRVHPPRLHRELLVGALMGLLVFTVAAERAAALPHVHGPGTFLPALLDEIACFDPARLSASAEGQVQVV